MLAPSFFDVPVYRLPPERYYADRQRYVEKIMFPDETMRQFYKNERAMAIRFEDHLITRYGGCWPFNEIIGYIRLHFLGSQIRGEYFGIQAKRITRTRTKVFEYKTHKLAPEINIPGDATNSAIAALVREYIGDCRRELAGRYVDSEIIDRLARFGDWRGLLGWSTESKAQL